MPANENTGRQIPEILTKGKYPVQQEHWEVLVDQFDNQMNSGAREYYGDEKAINDQVYYLEQGGEGGPKLVEAFTPEMDKYQRAQRLVKLLQEEGKPVFFANPSKISTARYEEWENYKKWKAEEDERIAQGGEPSQKPRKKPKPLIRGAQFTRLTLEGEPPKVVSTGAEKKPVITEKMPERIEDSPNWSRVDPEILEAKRPVEPDKPSGWMRFWNWIFGAYKDEIDEYNRSMETYHAEMENFRREERTWQVTSQITRDAFPENIRLNTLQRERQQELLDKFQSAQEKQIRDDLNQALTARQDELVQKSAKLPAAVSLNDPGKVTAKQAMLFAKNVMENQEMDIRVHEMCGPSGQSPMDLMRLKPLEKTPNIGSEWAALTLGALSNPEVTKGIAVGSTGAFVWEPDSPQEQIDYIQHNSMIEAMLVENIIGMAKADERCMGLEVALDKGREESDKAWKAFSTGNLEPAKKLLKDGFDFFIAASRGNKALSCNLGRGHARILKTLMECAEKHPELADEIDPKVLQEARGFGRLYDQYNKSLECAARLLSKDVKPEERKELLAEALVGCVFSGLDEKDQSVYKSTPEYMAAQAKMSYNSYDIIQMDMNAPPRERCIALSGDNYQKYFDKAKRDIAQTPKFQELLSMKPDELAEELSRRYNTPKLNALDVVEQKDSIVVEQARERQAQRRLSVSEPEARAVEQPAETRRRSSSVAEHSRKPQEGPKL